MNREHSRQLPSGEGVEKGVSSFGWEQVKAAQQDMNLRQKSFKEFGEFPERFFDAENQEMLGALSSAERVAILSFFSQSFMVTQDMVGLHFRRFPEDLHTIERVFEETDGEAQGFNFDLFIICAPFLSSRLLRDREYRDYRHLSYFLPYATIYVHELGNSTLLLVE